MLKPKYILIMIAMLPQLSQAFSWQDLWFNKDQQGAALLKQSKNSQAAEKFSDSNWRGTAYYKDKQYEKAYNEFKHDNSATGLYNQANSLANMQKYQEAIDAYTQAQKLEKDYPDAQHNKEIVEKLLEQQKQAKDSKQDQNKQDQDKQDQSKKDKSSDKQQNSENKKQDGSQQQQQDQQQKSEEQNKQQEQAKDQQAQNDAQKKQEQSKDNKASPQDSKQQQQDKQQEAANSADAAEKEKKAKEEAQAQAAKAGQKPEEKADKPAAAQMTPPQSYEQQQIKAELAKIPDDPGGLLRNKFIRDYERQKQEVNNNE